MKYKLLIKDSNNDYKLTIINMEQDVKYSETIASTKLAISN
jgi:hypothetical protein